ncbi:hypothetical protein BDN72DRAFT_802272, partial [Pluteus cervinus]
LTECDTACELQTCLNKNTYSPERCDALVRKLYTCCQSLYEKQGENVKASPCPLPRVVRRWLEQHHK